MNKFTWTNAIEFESCRATAAVAVGLGNTKRTAVLSVETFLGGPGSLLHGPGLGNTATGLVCYEYPALGWGLAGVSGAGVSGQNDEPAFEGNSAQAKRSRPVKQTDSRQAGSVSNDCINFLIYSYY